jgi:hypothetical protein
VDIYATLQPVNLWEGLLVWISIDPDLIFIRVIRRGLTAKRLLTFREQFKGILLRWDFWEESHKVSTSKSLRFHSNVSDYSEQGNLDFLPAQ